MEVDKLQDEFRCLLINLSTARSDEDSAVIETLNANTDSLLRGIQLLRKVS